MHPRATQTYIRPGIVRRQAVCPDHDRKSSEFRGVQWNMLQGRSYWAFACKGKDGHIFLALPAVGSPETAEEAAKWQEQQEAAKAGITYDSGGR